MKMFTLGADPEVFLEDQKGALFNAFTLIEDGKCKGIKGQPELTLYGGLQVDGMAMEYNTIPTPDPVRFSELITEGVVNIYERFKQPISNKSVKMFELDWLQEQHPLSVELGCDPDYNAWTNGGPNEPGDPSTNFRTAGGHVHIGWCQKKPIDDLEHTRDCIEAVKQMDYVLGMWSLLKDKYGSDRRKLYGKAGAYRPKPYGVEYRVLSNFWIFETSLAEEVGRRTIAGMKALEDGFWFSKEYGTMARDVITSGVIDTTAAKAMIDIDNTISRYL